MSVSAAEIETIVQAVLERLRALGGLPEVPSPPSVSDVGQRQALALSDRLVTLDKLPRDLKTIGKLSVPTAAVITPAVMDELRAHGVELLRVGPSAQSLPGGLRLLLIGPAGLQVDAAGVEFATSRGSVVADADRIGNYFSTGGQRVLWYSPTPYSALRAAASQPGLRAVLIPRLSELERALREADPNVTIADSERWTPAELQQLVSAMMERLRP